MNDPFSKRYKILALVQRKIPNGTTDMGHPKYILQPVIEDLKADIQPDNTQLAVNKSGITIKGRKILFCPCGTDIRPEDIITVLATGERYTVTQVDPFDVLPHLEVILESGVS
jgi:hypothetical protein